MDRNLVSHLHHVHLIPQDEGRGSMGTSEYRCELVYDGGEEGWDVSDR